jgi:phosphoribosylglycinamide formyltransferase-1
MADERRPLRLGFLASHGGTNMQAIMDACMDGRLAATPCVVISNNSASEALKRARRELVPAYHLSQTTHPSADDLDSAILNVLHEHRVNLVVLAGYMKRLGSLVLRRYPDRVLNIHPALLPEFGGKGMYGRAVHRAVLAAGETETGVTVHVVDDQYDHGPIVAQSRVPVLPGDDVDRLSQRVLKREHQLFVETLQGIESGEIDLERLAG